eukprot:1520819-Prymnesium_polylepis.2
MVGFRDLCDEKLSCLEDLPELFEHAVADRKVVDRRFCDGLRDSDSFADDRLASSPHLLSLEPALSGRGFHKDELSRSLLVLDRSLEPRSLKLGRTRCGVNAVMAMVREILRVLAFFEWKLLFSSWSSSSALFELCEFASISSRSAKRPCPRRLAQTAGDRLRRSCTAVEAPASMSRLIMLAWPQYAARCMGVMPCE